MLVETPRDPCSEKKAVGRILLAFAGAMSLYLRTGNSSGKAEPEHTQLKLESKPNRAWWVVQLLSTCVLSSRQAEFHGHTNSSVPVSKSCFSGAQQLPKSWEGGTPRQKCADY